MSFIKKRKWVLLTGTALICTAALVFAVGRQISSDLAGIGITADGSTIVFNKPFTNTGTTVLSGTTTLLGATSISSSIAHTATAVSLTSPTTAFTAAGTDLIVLQSDANATGLTLTNGALYQVVRLFSGAGSNTMRFDDATSFTLGGNITLTEGQEDVLTVMCTSADGDEWTAVSAHDN